MSASAFFRIFSLHCFEFLPREGFPVYVLTVYPYVSRAPGFPDTVSMKLISSSVKVEQFVQFFIRPTFCSWEGRGRTETFTFQVLVIFAQHDEETEHACPHRATVLSASVLSFSSTTVRYVSIAHSTGSPVTGIIHDFVRERRSAAFRRRQDVYTFHVS